MSKYIELGKVKEMVFNADMSMAETEALYKSLDNLPTIEVIEDCIDRKALLEQKYKAKDIFDTEYEDWFVFVPTIENAPSVIPSRAEGEWKRHPIHENRAWDVCTACGTGCRRRHYGFNEDGTEWVEQANYPFCPNCGAKMKG